MTLFPQIVMHVVGSMFWLVTCVTFLYETHCCLKFLVSVLFVDLESFCVAFVFGGVVSVYGGIVPSMYCASYPSIVLYYYEGGYASY